MILFCPRCYAAYRAEAPRPCACTPWEPEPGMGAPIGIIRNGELDTSKEATATIEAEAETKH